jgi:Arc/MetJ-type ribon-helix-helix transcriptional regulator
MIQVTWSVPSGAQPRPINVTLADEMRFFVQKQVESGAFPSEAVALHEAVRRFRQEDQASGHANKAEKAPEEMGELNCLSLV